MILFPETLSDVTAGYLDELLQHGWAHAERILEIKREDYDELRLADVFAWLDGRQNGSEPTSETEWLAAHLVGGVVDLKCRIERGVPTGWAIYQLGKVCALMHGTACKLDERKRCLSSNARNAADARHAENREIAARIQAWYAENHHRFPSMDKAAEAVMRIEPVAFKTARKHIGAAAKNLPFARKE